MDQQVFPHRKDILKTNLQIFLNLHLHSHLSYQARPKGNGEFEHRISKMFSTRLSGDMEHKQQSEGHQLFKTAIKNI